MCKYFQFAKIHEGYMGERNALYKIFIVIFHVMSECMCTFEERMQVCTCLFIYLFKWVGFTLCHFGSRHINNNIHVQLSYFFPLKEKSYKILKKKWNWNRKIFKIIRIRICKESQIYIEIIYIYKCKSGYNKLEIYKMVT